MRLDSSMILCIYLTYVQAYSVRSHNSHARKNGVQHHDTLSLAVETFKRDDEHVSVHGHRPDRNSRSRVKRSGEVGGCIGRTWFVYVTVSQTIGAVFVVCFLFFFETAEEEKRGAMCVEEENYTSI